MLAKFDRNQTVFFKSKIDKLTVHLNVKIRIMAIWWRKIMLAAYFGSLARSNMVVDPPSVIFPVSMK